MNEERLLNNSSSSTHAKAQSDDSIISLRFGGLARDNPSDVSNDNLG